MKLRFVLRPRFSPLILIVVITCLTSCSPRQLPGLKQQAKAQEERITRETAEAIRKSPKLQELDRLCTAEVPRPEGFVLVKRSRDFNDESFLSYGYDSSRLLKN